jgi:hypothetical protein
MMKRDQSIWPLVTLEDQWACLKTRPMGRLGNKHITPQLTNSQRIHSTPSTRLCAPIVPGRGFWPATPIRPTRTPTKSAKTLGERGSIYLWCAMATVLMDTWCRTTSRSIILVLFSLLKNRILPINDRTRPALCKLYAWGYTNTHTEAAGIEHRL